MHKLIQSYNMLTKFQIQNNGIPIYIQIREQLLGAIGAGVLGPGEQLPTMRQVAVTLKVDLNTVRHAYEELEQAGAIVIRRARGTFVADHPPPLDPAKQAQRLESFAQQVVATARAAGIEPRDVAQWITNIANRKDAPS
jgi:GntR family transcriptional regulator